MLLAVLYAFCLAVGFLTGATGVVCCALGVFLLVRQLMS